MFLFGSNRRSTDRTIKPMELNTSKKIREKAGSSFQIDREVETRTKAGSDCRTAQLRACILVASFRPFPERRSTLCDFGTPGRIGRAAKLISSQIFLRHSRVLSNLERFPDWKISQRKTELTILLASTLYISKVRVLNKSFETK